jgi:hypothetical protein
MQIIHYAPLIGSPGEALWHEGEASYVLAGRAERRAVTRPPVDLVAWCAVVDNEHAGIQVCRLAPLNESGVAHGLLSWVKPAYRRRGVFAAIQAAVDAALLAQGMTAIRSWVVAGPDADAMEAAIVARGGMRQTVAPRETVTGDQVQYVEFLRPLVS